MSNKRSETRKHCNFEIFATIVERGRKIFLFEVEISGERDAYWEYIKIATNGCFQ